MHSPLGTVEAVQLNVVLIAGLGGRPVRIIAARAVRPFTPYETIQELSPQNVVRQPRGPAPGDRVAHALILGDDSNDVCGASHWPEHSAAVKGAILPEGFNRVEEPILLVPYDPAIDVIVDWRYCGADAENCERAKQVMRACIERRCPYGP